jgi:ribosomal protein L12E/L44/L45/RPP1/RPP2
MKPISILLSSLLITVGLAHGGPAQKLSDFQTVLELARTVSLLSEIGMPFDAAQAKTLLVVLHNLDLQEAITPSEATKIVTKLEGALRPAQLAALIEKRQALEAIARKRATQARTSNTNALTVLSWTVPGGPLILAIIEREMKVNPFRVKGSQEAFEKLMVALEKRVRIR